MPAFEPRPDINRLPPGYSLMWGAEIPKGYERFVNGRWYDDDLMGKGVLYVVRRKEVALAIRQWRIPALGFSFSTASRAHYVAAYDQTNVALISYNPFTKRIYTALEPLHTVSKWAVCEEPSWATNVTLP